MRTRLAYSAWLLFRHCGIAVLVVVAFPVFTAGFYVVASVAGAHTSDDKGDLVLAIPFAGAAFLIACLITLLMLFPAMFVSDLFRIIKGWQRSRTLLPGLATVLLALLPWQITAAEGFSWRAFLMGGGFLIVVFFMYWGSCQIVDLFAEKILTFITRKLPKPI